MSMCRTASGVSRVKELHIELFAVTDLQDFPRRLLQRCAARYVVRRGGRSAPNLEQKLRACHRVRNPPDCRAQIRPVWPM